MKLKTEIPAILALVFLTGLALGRPTTNHAVSLEPTLPVPSGSYAIGRQVFDWIDHTRVDELSAAPGKHRELMAYIWYPAVPSKRMPLADYFPDANEIAKNSAAEQAARNIFGRAWLRIARGSLRSHAIAGASPVVKRGGFPVILFSHGSSASSFSYTAQIEDYVSHGYVVVAIDHPGLAGLVRFSDGHVRLFHSPPTPSVSSKDPMQAAIGSAEVETQIGAEDLSFVLDSLAKLQGPLAEIMNLDRVAAVGHSAGGTITVRACQIDRRIKACVSEDGEVNPVGVFFNYPDHARMKQPFLLIELAEQHSDEELVRMGESRAQWNNYVAHENEQLNTCAPGSYRVVLNKPGFNHSSFSDGPLLNATPRSRDANSALINLQLAEMLVRRFIDSVLKVENAPPFSQVARTSPIMKVTAIGQ